MLFRSRNYIGEVGVVVSLLRVFGVRRRRWPWSRPKSATVALKARPFSSCELGLEARRSLSTTPDDCPSPRHAIRRRTLGGARLAAVRWNHARGSTTYPYPGRFLASPQVTGTTRKWYLCWRCYFDARSVLAIRALRPVALAAKAGSAGLRQPGKRGASPRIRNPAVNPRVSSLENERRLAKRRGFSGQQM